MADDHDVDGLAPYLAPVPKAGRGARAYVVVAVISAAAVGGGGFAAGWADRGGSRPAADAAAATTGTVRFAPMSAGAGMSVIYPGGPPPGSLPIGRWGAPGGIEVRAFVAPTSTPLGADVPDACFPDRQATVELSDTPAVVAAGVPLYSLAGATSRVVAADIWGLSEGAPAAWAVVETAPSIVRVTASFAGGSSDSVTPVQGIAVLASRVQPSAGVGGTVTLSSAAGVKTTLALAPTPGPADPTKCIPPPPPGQSLPAPGVQPAGAGTARAEIAKAYAEMFSIPPGVPMSNYIQGADQSTVQAQQAAAARNPKDKASASVQQVVFTSPTTAAVRYEIILNGNPLLSQVGQAVLDGTWKATLSTACGLFRMGGGTC